MRTNFFSSSFLLFFFLLLSSSLFSLYLPLSVSSLLTVGSKYQHSIGLTWTWCIPARWPLVVHTQQLYLRLGVFAAWLIVRSWEDFSSTNTFIYIIYTYIYTYIHTYLTYTYIHIHTYTLTYTYTYTYTYIHIRQVLRMYVLIIESPSPISTWHPSFKHMSFSCRTETYLTSDITVQGRQPSQPRSNHPYITRVQWW